MQGGRASEFFGGLNAALVDMSEAPFFIETSPVRATQMVDPFLVVTREGLMQGKPGDYLCEGVEGERWPIDKGIFEKTYRPKDCCSHVQQCKQYLLERFEDLRHGRIDDGDLDAIQVLMEAVGS